MTICQPSKFDIDRLFEHVPFLFCKVSCLKSHMPVADEHFNEATAREVWGSD